MDRREGGTNVVDGVEAVVPPPDRDAESSPGPRRRARRRHAMMRLLAASIGLGALSRIGTQTAQAANGDPVLAGQTVDATAPTRVRNGVAYTPDSTADGVQGYATGANNAGLFGRNNVTDGIGVSGTAPSGTGVFGESLNGFGIGGKSDSKYGVYGKSTSGEGVYGESTSAAAVRGVSTSGVGGAFGGGLAAIRLVPAASGTGAPTSGTHQVGELYADSTGVLYYCTVAGTPGTWLPVVLGSGGGSGMTNPMTAQDDLIVGGTSGAPARLGKGSNGQVLTLNGSGHVSWATPSGGGGGGGPAWQRPLVAPPALTSFTWVNQGSATAVEDAGGIFMTVPAIGATNLRILKKSLPATPYTVTAAFVPQLYSAPTNSFGIVLYQSSDGKLVYHEIGTGGGSIFVAGAKYSAATAYASGYSTWPIISLAEPIWLRCADNGTTRTWSWSIDGKNWVVDNAHGHTDYLTANEVGFAVDASNGTYGPSAKLVSWEVD